MNSQQRKDMILKYIVEDFIATAEPVGSNALLGKHRLDMSSATIRNVMAGLEKDGLIEKTHTSSGRVPSTAGYRYYVEKLGSGESLKRNVAEGFEKEFALVFKSKTQSVEDTIQKACEVLSQVTSLAIVVLGNEARNETLVSVSMIPLSPVAATVILVTDRGSVENKTFPMPKGVDIKAVTYGVKLLNDRLAGTKISDLESKTRALEPILKSQVGRDSKIVVEAFVDAFLSFAKKRYKAYGTTNLLGLPEFSDEEAFRKAVSYLGEGLDPESADTVKAQVGPGTNVSLSDRADVAVVSQSFNLPGLPAGDIAVVGPRRMDYKKVILLLRGLAKTLADYYESTGETPPKVVSKKDDDKKGGNEG